MTAQEQAAAEQSAIMARIAKAPTRAGKVNALLNALDWMRSIKVDSTGAQPGRLTRDRRIFDLTAVGEFFHAVNRNDLAADFIALVSILSDLDRGLRHKTLEEAPRKGGQTPRGSDVWRGRAHVAAAVDTLHRAPLRMKMKDIKRVIDAHLELRLLLDEKKRASEHALGDAAEAWREHFNSGAVDNFEATAAYNHYQSLAAQYASPDELKRYAEKLLRLATMKANEIERDSS